jgi:GWxTD domain-containing protein
MGRFASDPPIRFIGTMVTAAGPGDSAVAVLGLSLENRALVFQREDNGFVARYRVELTLQRGDDSPIEVRREEIVRVGTFKETLRADESILFQQSFHLVPGDYHIVMSIRDRASPSLSTTEGDFSVGAFEAGSTSEPIIVYQVTGRDSEAAPLSVLLNPRGAVAYGGDTLLAYVEGYGFTQATSVPYEVRDRDENVVFTDSLRFAGRQAIESQIIRLAPDSQPLGELTIVVGTPPNERSAKALVSFSEAWIVTNFEEMINLLRFFGQDQKLSKLKDATEEDRPRLWREFWRDTDPNTVTPENEALDAYFQRVALANARFRGEDRAGWRTERGEVFITLGDPDETFDASPTSQGRIIRWTYTSLRLTIFFEDVSGFGRFRMTPASRSAYENVLNRVRRSQ